MVAARRTIVIGQGPDGPVTLDVDVMLRSGLLVQANSGGGKSWVLRRLAEQLCAHVPTFVVDVEGEFASLRERFPFFLVAKQGGDTAADPRSAALVARKLLELRVSAVFDLFELDLPDRHRWLASFLGAMDQAPREVWGDTALLIDEAHVFAPEKGKGESVALAGMAALASRGRKRGFGPVDATQRIGKLNKDVASELKNALVGLAWMDIDRDRAIESLGIGRKERPEYDRQLRGMEPGEFFAIGRAFGTLDPVKVKIGGVESTHPEPGQAKAAAAPPPPAKIRAMLAKLGDLPKEAAASLDTEASLRAEVARLTASLRGQTFTVDPAAAAELATLRQKLTALDGVTPTEIRRLRDLETRFEAVRSALNGTPIPAPPPVASKVTVATPPAPPRAARAPAAKPARSTPVTTTQPEGWTMEEEAFYQRVVERLKREAPMLLKVMAVDPVLEVEIKTETVTVDGSSLKGRIAGLIPDGFFDEPKSAAEVLAELRRLGGPRSDSNNHNAVLNWLAEHRFLTVEANGFQAVAGMKVNVKR